MVTKKRSALPPFWTLVEDHGGELLRHARRLVGDEAEDVLQEALLRALRGYNRLPHGDHLRAWLYRVTTTTAFDWSRRRARRDVPHENLDGGGRDGGGLEDVANLDGFDALVEDFSPRVREALVLRYVEDLEYDSIGLRLGCTPAAARKRVSGALQELRRKLG